MIVDTTEPPLPGVGPGTHLRVAAADPHNSAGSTHAVGSTGVNVVRRQVYNDLTPVLAPCRLHAWVEHRAAECFLHGQRVVRSHRFHRLGGVVPTSKQSHAVEEPPCSQPERTMPAAGRQIHRHPAPVVTERPVQEAVAAAVSATGPW